MKIPRMGVFPQHSLRSATAQNSKQRESDFKFYQLVYHFYIKILAWNTYISKPDNDFNMDIGTFQNLKAWNQAHMNPWKGDSNEYQIIYFWGKKKIPNNPLVQRSAEHHKCPVYTSDHLEAIGLYEQWHLYFDCMDIKADPRLHLWYIPLVGISIKWLKYLFKVQNLSSSNNHKFA